MHLLESETLHNYGGEKDYIEVPVTLRSGEQSVSFPAQLDTGATYCVFERTYAEILGSGAMFWADAAGSITFGSASSSTKANSL